MYGVSARMIGRSLCRRLYRHLGSRLASVYSSVMVNDMADKLYSGRHGAFQRRSAAGSHHWVDPVSPASP